MHADEFAIDVALVRRLLIAQFPQWAALPLAQIKSAGTVNAIFRLGDELAVRLPRRAEWVGELEKERRWLPQFAPKLQLAIPQQIAIGEPDAAFPWSWAIYRWLPGDNAAVTPITDLRQAALDLAEFIVGLRQLDCADGPPSGRGKRFELRVPGVQKAIAELAGTIDINRVEAEWQVCLQMAHHWNGESVWTHGDLIAPNILVQDGRITAVIDFGSAGVGDPACELVAAWSILDEDSRAVFRRALDIDDETWMRGRGWALSQALMIIPYYRYSNQLLVDVARRMVHELIGDVFQDSD